MIDLKDKLKGQYQQTNSKYQSHKASVIIFFCIETLIALAIVSFVYSYISYEQELHEKQVNNSAVVEKLAADGYEYQKVEFKECSKEEKECIILASTESNVLGFATFRRDEEDWNIFSTIDNLHMENFDPDNSSYELIEAPSNSDTIFVKIETNTNIIVLKIENNTSQCIFEGDEIAFNEFIAKLQGQNSLKE